MKTMQVDVVSAEELIYSGLATFVALPGEVGELGIYPRHTPLISRIRAGSVPVAFWKCSLIRSPSYLTQPFAAKTWTKSAPTPPKKRQRNI